MEQRIISKIDSKIEDVWSSLIEMGHTKLVRLNPPKVVFSNRIYRTAGRCYRAARTIELGAKFFRAYAPEMIAIIVPHEIMHQADFDLFGESEKICGHGANWRMLMLQYGLPDDKFHSLHIDRQGNKL